MFARVFNANVSALIQTSPLIIATAVILLMNE